MAIYYVRIYRMASEEVIVDCPMSNYQDIYNAIQEDKCPAPWRFRDGNPDKETYQSMEIMDYDDFQTAVSGCDDGGATQLYYDGSNNLQGDSTWEVLLIPKEMILDKRRRRLEGWMLEELALETPDMDKVNAWQWEKKTLKTLTDKQVYEVALDSLQYAAITKDAIREQLQVLLGIPVNVEATEGDTEIDLTWDEVAEADSYKIYWGTEAGVYTDDDTSATNSYTITELTNDTPYFIAVVAIKDSVESRKSDEKEATPVAA